MNETPEYYVSVCTDTDRQFLVQTYVDNNIIELTQETVKTLRQWTETGLTPRELADQRKALIQGLFTLLCEQDDKPPHEETRGEKAARALLAECEIKTEKERQNEC